MNIREAIRRHLNETHQVTQTRRYKWLSAIGLILLFASVFHVFEPEYWQLRRVRRQIENISPQWDAFKRAHPGFEAVELFPRYDEANCVSLAAKGRVHWSVDVNQLAEFMSSTKLPVSINVFQVAKDFSDAPSAPGFKKVSVLIDGKRVEIAVPTDSYHSSDVISARSKAEPASPANGRQPIRSETNSTSSSAGSRR
jgi:hypothetical protein